MIRYCKKLLPDRLRGNRVKTHTWADRWVPINWCQVWAESISNTVKSRDLYGIFFDIQIPTTSMSGILLRISIGNPDILKNNSKADDIIKLPNKLGHKILKDPSRFNFISFSSYKSIYLYRLTFRCLGVIHFWDRNQFRKFSWLPWLSYLAQLPIDLIKALI